MGLRGLAERICPVLLSGFFFLDFDPDLMFFSN